MREPQPLATPVYAAGGVVVRAGAGGCEVLLVHRPRYDDWTFPKGKREPGERDEDTAGREVREETGYRCRLGAELDSVEYIDRHGRTKTVRYWHMTVEGGDFVPNDEVDVIAWLDVATARQRLTYEHDRALLDRIDTR